MKILKYELKKLLSLPHILVIAAALIVQLAICFIPVSSNHLYSKEIYKSYIDELYGSYTNDKEQFINDRYESLLKSIENYEAISDDYKNNKISLEEFDAYNFEYNNALSQLTTVEYLKSKCDYFNQTDGEYTFFYDTDWEDFLNSISFDYVTALVVFFIIISVFCPEYESGAHSMMLTTVKGRSRICIYKLLTSFAMAFLIAFLLHSVKYIGFIVQHTDYSDMPIKNLIGYSEFDNITLQQYYFQNIFIKAISWAVGGVFICLASNLTHNGVFSAFISFVFIVCTSMLSELSTNVFRYILIGVSLSDNLDSEFNLFVFLILSLIKVVLYSVLSVMCWNKSELEI